MLGPLLFNLYINDIKHIDLNATFVIYADDSTILHSGPDENSLMLKCNAVPHKLFHWSSSNRIKVNPTKKKQFYSELKTEELN